LTTLPDFCHCIDVQLALEAQQRPEHVGVDEAAGGESDAGQGAGDEHDG
jgi:hypothetical protein